MLPFILNRCTYFDELYLSLSLIRFIHPLYYFLLIFLCALSVCTLVKHINNSISEPELAQVVPEVLK